MDEPGLVADPGEVEAIAAECAAAGAMALDLEFVAQDRYRPDLALVQVAWRRDDAVEIRLVDAVAVDAGPVIALAGGGIDVVLHAARQDLQIVATRFGVRVRRLFDTQVAAAFAGLGDQIGYARLVEAMLGARLGKEQQWTDWLRRPLAPAQLRYAADDVRYLPVIADALAGRLDASGRRGWVDAECDVLAQIAHDAAQIEPDSAWREVSGARALDAAGRAASRRLAAWRQREALALNQPPSWLLADRGLLELAKSRPRDERAIAKVRGLGEHARKNAAALAAALVAASADVEAGDVPPAATAWAPPGPRAQLWEEVILAVVQAASEETGIAARWLATRGDAEDLARALDARRDGAFEEIEHPILRTWRREVIGDRILAWLRGEAALVGDATTASGVKMVPR